MRISSIARTRRFIYYHRRLIRKEEKSEKKPHMILSIKQKSYMHTLRDNRIRTHIQGADICRVFLFTTLNV